MFFRHPSISYPPDMPLLTPSEAGMMVYHLDGNRNGPPLPPRVRARHADRLVESLRDLELMTLRAKIALGLWSHPVLSDSAAMEWLGVPPGAHPLRILSCLVELHARGELSHPDGAAAWSGYLQDRADSLFMRHGNAGDQTGVLNVLRMTFPGEWGRPRPVVNLEDWDQVASQVGGHFQAVLDAGARGRMAREALSERSHESWLDEGTDRAHEVFVRHQAGESFPVPALTQEDLVMLSQSPLPAVRSLAVTLTPWVAPLAPVPLSGRRR